MRGLLAGLSSKMYEIKYECTGYLNAMLRFVNAGTYSAMNTALASLANAERNYAKNAYPEISESFPGLAEARELVLEKKEEMSGILAQSTAFVAAVTNIGTDGVLTLELAAAIEERDKTDLTVPDAATAKKTLDRYLAMYEGARSFGAEEFSFWLSFAVAG